MMPISEIHIGDIFQNPFLGRDSLTYCVTDVNKLEHLVQVQPYDRHCKESGKPFWKKNTDRMFTESWRLLCTGL
jgi:hypothetical protein